MKLLVLVLGLALLTACYERHQQETVTGPQVTIAVQGEVTGKTVTFHYDVPRSSPLYGRHGYYTLLYEWGTKPFFRAYALDETTSDKPRKGYLMLHGRDKGVVLPKEGARGYSSVFLLDEPTGTTTVTFATQQEVNLFLDITWPHQNWDDAWNVRKQSEPN